MSDCCECHSPRSECDAVQDNALLHFCGTTAASAPRQALVAAHAYIRERTGNVVLTNRAVTALVDNAKSLPFVKSVEEFLEAMLQGNPSSSVPIDAFLELPSRTTKWLKPHEAKTPEATMRAVRFILCVHYVESQWTMHCRKCASCSKFNSALFALFKDFERTDINEILEEFPFVEAFPLSASADFHFVLDTFEILPPAETKPTLPLSATPFVPSFAKKDREEEDIDDLTRRLVEGTETDGLHMFQGAEQKPPAFPLFDGAPGIVKDGIQFPGKPGEAKLVPPQQKGGEHSHIQKLIDQQAQTGVPAAPREWVQAVVDQALMQAQSAIFAGIRARQGELVGALVNKKEKQTKPAASDKGDETDTEYMPIPWSWCPWLPKESLYRVKMCSYFYHTGHCNKGESCNFSHEMLPGMPPPKPPSSVRHGVNSKKSSSPKLSTKCTKEDTSFTLFEDKYPKSVYGADN